MEWLDAGNGAALNQEKVPYFVIGVDVEFYL